jgi:hypothetical protein
MAKAIAAEGGGAAGRGAWLGKKPSARQVSSEESASTGFGEGPESSTMGNLVVVRRSIAAFAAR